MKASFDKYGYFTGNYAVIGDIKNTIYVEEVPDETDTLRLKSYQYEDGKWYFDSERYRELLSSQCSTEFADLKEKLISQSKKNLEQYLETYRLTSSCHKGSEKQYSITSEKQSYLSSMILTAQAAEASGMQYHPSWNASGEECTYDWTIEELIQLAMEMESVVRPLVSKQQSIEVAIKNAGTIEELEEIDISF